MKEKSFPLINKGMNRDLSISEVGKSSAYDNHNIRITARDHDTLLSITNERGNKELSLVGTIHGDLIGWNVLNDHLVIFTTGEAFPQSEEQDGRQWHDHIYRIDREDQGYTLTALYHGELGFDIQHPIESVVYFETEDLQKIYWVDGVNVLRFMNFMATPAEIQKWADAVTAGDYTVFDSNRVSEFDVDVTITKDNAGNVRPNGVVQYLITYFTNHGSETGYVWMSDLVYLSPSDRGGEADGTNTNNVMLTIKNLDIRFTHFRVYSVMRTEYNGTTQAYLVGEYEIPTKVVNHQTVSDTIIVTDDGGHLTAEDSSKLLYLGSQPVIAGTLEHKDDTLFLGELHSIGKDDYKKLTDAIATMRDNNGICQHLWFEYSDDGDVNNPISDIDYAPDNGAYSYNSQLQMTSSQISGFKGGEKYRFGLKFQRADGADTETFWLGDRVNTLYPMIDVITGKIRRIIALCSLQANVITEMKALGFKTVQLMIAEASDADRSVKAQGILNPTMFNVWERYNNGLYSIPSWISRPRNSGFSWKHFTPVHNATTSLGEIACNYWTDEKEPTPYFRYTDYDNQRDYVDHLDGKAEHTFVMLLFSVYVTGSSTWFSGKRQTVQMWIYYITMFSTKAADISAAKKFEIVPPSIYDKEKVVESNRAFEITAIEGTLCEDSCDQEACDRIAAKLAAYAEKKKDIPLGALPSGATIYAWKESSDTAAKPWEYHNPKFENAVLGVGDDYHPSAAAINYKTSGETEPSAYRWYDVRTTQQIYEEYYQPAFYKKHLMFVDENVVTLNSPEIEYGLASVDNAGYKLRVVGAAKMSSVISDYTVDATRGHLPETNLDRIDFSAHRPSAINGLISWPMWLENGLVDDEDNPESDIEKRTSKNYSWGSSVAHYFLHMWERNGKITGFAGDEENEDYSTLHKKTFANLRFAYHTIYRADYSGQNPYSYELDSLRLFNQVSSSYTQIQIGDDKRFYDGVVNTSLLVPGSLKYPIPYVDHTPETGEEIQSSQYYMKTDVPVQISYASPAHAVMSLHSEISGGKYHQRILPRLFPSEAPVIPERDTVSSPKVSGSIIPWNNHTLGLIDYLKYNDNGDSGVKRDPFEEATITLVNYDSGSKRATIRIVFTAVADWAATTLPEVLYQLSYISKGKDFYTRFKIGDNAYLVRMNGAKKESSNSVILKNAFVKTVAPTVSGSADVEIETRRTYWQGLNTEDPTERNYSINYDENYTCVLNLTTGEWRGNDSYPYIDYAADQDVFDFGDFNLIGIPDNREKILSGDQYLLIGELYRDFDGTEYGGTSEAAIAANRFIKAGPAYLVDDMPDEDEYDIIGNEGDTYFQRWDCVKTKPYSDDSVNNVIDITSVMLESHINLDGRCDLQRGLNKLASLNLDEFGKMNPVYSQKNNFLISRDLPADFDLNSYRSSITWTLPKKDMASVDEWTHITLASTLKLDGNKGFCRAMRRFQNSLIAFQDKGIAEILFNSRTQLSTADGVPVEIANSGKVDGKYYLTNKYGCLNKWSIVEGKQGLYFVDDHNKAFCGAGFNKYGKLQVENISSKLGFDTWFRNKSNLEPWHPKHGRTIVSFYDKVHSDVYLVNAASGYSDDCLVYNETLGVFTSFFDYGGVQMMANIGLDFVSYKDNKFWLQNQGFYGRFFGDQYDYWTTYRVTPEPYGDKIWTNVEYQADMHEVLSSDGYDSAIEEPINDGHYIPNDTFDSLRVWNEYQDTSNSNPSPVKKFRRWRYAIPRANKTDANKWGLDRIRNPWIMLRLAKSTANNDRRMMQIHDVIVKYFE